jgi:drug/metabolite transporter (DMT)-like permease
MLALHFWAWNASVGLTTIAASVVLVDTQPLVVAALSTLWLREPPSRRQWLGIVVAVAGAVLVVWPDFAARSTASSWRRAALLGDALALVGALTAAVYYVCGRRLRGTLDLWPYVALVYGACLAVLVVLAVVVGAPLGAQPPRELAIFAGLAVGPMLLGHTGLNWALRYLPAYVVNVSVLGEPVFATLIAALLPAIREVPTLATLTGGAVILTGIYVTTVERSPRAA